ELGLGLAVVRVGDAAVDRAHGGARLLPVEPDALGAERGVDDVDVLTLRDRAVRALGLAGAAVDALLGDDRGHRSLSRRWGGPASGRIERAIQLGSRAVKA